MGMLSCSLSVRLIPHFPLSKLIGVHLLDFIRLVHFKLHHEKFAFIPLSVHLSLC